MYEYVEASSSWKQKGHSKGGKVEQDMFGSSVAINEAGDRWILTSAFDIFAMALIHYDKFVESINHVWNIKSHSPNT